MTEDNFWFIKTHEDIGIDLNEICRFDPMEAKIYLNLNEKDQIRFINEMNIFMNEYYPKYSDENHGNNFKDWIDNRLTEAERSELQFGGLDPTWGIPFYEIIDITEDGESVIMTPNGEII